MLLNKEKNFISIVVYIHNSKTSIITFLETVNKIFEENFEKYEYIFVNDDSKDDSILDIKEHIKCNWGGRLVNIVNMGAFQGVESSMSAGVDLAIGDFVFEFDNTSINYPENLIMDIYQKALKGYDVVAAVPNNSSKNLSSDIFYKLYNFARINKKYKLQRETFRIISRRAINRVKMATKSITYRKVSYLDCGLPYAFIKYSEANTDNKITHDPFENNMRKNLGINSLILFTNIVSQITITLSIFFLIFAICIGIYTIQAYLGASKPVEGWAPLMGFLSVGFTGVFTIFAIVIKYLALILNMIFKKKSYLIESIEKVTK